LLSIFRQISKCSFETPESAAYFATVSPNIFTSHKPKSPDNPTESGTSIPIPNAASSCPRAIFSDGFATTGRITPNPSLKKDETAVEVSRRFLLIFVVCDAFGSVRVCATFSVALLAGQGSV